MTGEEINTVGQACDKIGSALVEWIRVLKNAGYRVPIQHVNPLDPLKSRGFVADPFNSEIPRLVGAGIGDLAESELRTFAFNLNHGQHRPLIRPHANVIEAVGRSLRNVASAIKDSRRAGDEDTLSEGVAKAITREAAVLRGNGLPGLADALLAMVAA